MEYLTIKHAVLNFQFTNYFYGSVKIIGAGTNGETWGFTRFQSLPTIQLPLACEGLIPANRIQHHLAHTYPFAHYRLPGLVSFNTEDTDSHHLCFLHPL